MIHYKDFTPEVTQRGPFGGPSEIENFSSVMETANQWIEQNSIDLINIETVVLPDTGRISPWVDKGMYVTAYGEGGRIFWLQCVRIWYRAN